VAKEAHSRHSLTGRPVDAWPSSHISNGADRAVRAPLVLASGCAPGGPARRHLVAVHGNWYLLHQISLSSAIPWLVRGLRVGAALVVEGGEQVQSLRLVGSAKQVVEGRPDQARRTGERDLPALSL
jgi:hypothetical protein